MIVDPETVGTQEVYKLLIGAIVPRPIAFVSSVSGDGVRNLAPFSFFTVASADPPVVCFCAMFRKGQPKDTLRNIRETGEFVVNIVSEEIVEQMNVTSGDWAPEVDEFEKSGLTPVRSERVNVPRVAESHVSMECKLQQIVEASAKPMGGNLVLGEIVRFHVDDRLMRDARIDPERLRAVGRMGGTAYARTHDLFELERPKV